MHAHHTPARKPTQPKPATDWKRIGKIAGGLVLSVPLFYLLAMVVGIVWADRTNASSLAAGFGFVFLALIALAVFLVAYFVPALIAWGLKHPHALPIFILNLCLGWTLIFWVAALVWAAMPRSNQLSTAFPGPREHYSSIRR